MTTIFADANSGVMVCDSMCSLDDEWFEATKVVYLRDDLIGFSGSWAEAQAWLSWYESNQSSPAPKTENCNALFLGAQGLRLMDSAGGLILIERGFMGTGSGGKCATAAFIAGATPKRAVQIACDIDSGSGGKVVVHKLKGKK